MNCKMIGLRLRRIGFTSMWSRDGEAWAHGGKARSLCLFRLVADDGADDYGWCLIAGRWCMGVWVMGA